MKQRYGSYHLVGWLLTAVLLLGACTSAGREAGHIADDDAELTKTSLAPTTPPPVDSPASEIESLPSHTHAPSDGPIEAGDSERVELDVGEEERSFILSVPEGYSNQQAWPVILAFHGYGETAEALQRYSLLDSSAALVIYGEGVGRAWSPAPYARTSVEEDIAYVRAAVDWVRERYWVKDNHIVATGFSNGGGFAAALACRIPTELSAVAAVGAAYYEDVFDDCSDHPIPYLDIHGTADRTINYEGGTRWGESYLAVPEVLEGIGNRNGCSSGSTIRPESLATVVFTFNDCEAPLRHIRGGGGGHIWPGSRFDSSGLPSGYATYRILEFSGIGWRWHPSG